MKQAVNFRLSNKAITTLSFLEERLHTSKTAIIENAIQVYAKSKELSKNPLIKYAGILSEDEGHAILKTIKDSRHNKNFSAKL